MRLLRRKFARSRAGFSLIEVTVASTLFVLVGYVFVVSVDMGTKSQALVMNSSAENRSVRSAATTLVSEIQVSTEDEIVVEALPDGNSQVTLKVPIAVAGLLTWGTEAEEITMVAGVENEPHQGWSYRYTVQTAGNNKRLLRQILDEQLAVQSEEVLVARLDTANQPSFSVQKSGDMWVVNIASDNRVRSIGEGQNGYATQQRRNSEFHVRTRN